MAHTEPRAVKSESGYSNLNSVTLAALQVFQDFETVYAQS